MPIQGLRTTGNFGANERPQSWREQILLYEPNGDAPFTAFTSLMKSEKVTDPRFNWFSKTALERRVQLSGNITAGATTIPIVSGGLMLKLGDILRFLQTDEVMLVTAVASDTSITVTRGFGGTTNAAITLGVGVNPFGLSLGSVYEEGSVSPTGVGNEPITEFNFTQIFRDRLDMTRTAMQTRLRTGDQVKEARREGGYIHMLGIERAFLFGVRWEGPLNGRPARTTGGVTSFLPSDNVVSAGATTSLLQLEGFIERMFRQGSEEKVGFCGSTALLVLQQIVRRNSDYQMFAGEKEYGMNVRRFVTPFGTLVLRQHKMFNLDRLATGQTHTTALASSLLVLDMSKFRYRYMQDTVYQPKLGANDLDGMQSGFLTEAGIEVHQPAAHFWLRGLTASALD